MKKGKYRHKSGKEYEVLDVVVHSETLEKMVLYRCLYENDMSEVWVRPIDMFVEPRFIYIGDEDGEN